MDCTNSEIIDQIRKFNENLEKLQSELTVAKHVNSVFSEKLVSMERQCWANAQYSGREYLGLSSVKPICFMSSFLNFFFALSIFWLSFQPKISRLSFYFLFTYPIASLYIVSLDKATNLFKYFLKPFPLNNPIV